MVLLKIMETALRVATIHVKYAVKAAVSVAMMIHYLLMAAAIFLYLAILQQVVQIADIF